MVWAAGGKKDDFCAKNVPRAPRGAARAAGGGPCDGGASSPVVPAHGRVTHVSSGRPVEPAARWLFRGCEALGKEAGTAHCSGGTERGWAGVTAVAGDLNRSASVAVGSFDEHEPTERPARARRAVPRWSAAHGGHGRESALWRQRGAAREAGGGPCDGASSPVVPAHGRVTHASSGRPVEPAAGVLSTAVALRIGGHGTARTRTRRLFGRCAAMRARSRSARAATRANRAGCPQRGDLRGPTVQTARDSTRTAGPRRPGARRRTREM